MGKYFDKLNEYCEKAAALTAVMNLVDYDTQVTAPPEADEYTSKVMGILADEYHALFTGKKAVKLIKKSLGEYKKGRLNPKETVILKQYIRIHRQLMPIPSEEYREFKELTARAVNVWAKAKKNKAFEDFAPMLEEIVKWKRLFAGYRCRQGMKEYDVLLGDYEPDFNMEKLDAIFETVKKKVGPVVKMYANNAALADETFDKAHFDKESMCRFCQFLSEYLGLDMEAAVVSESEHPFTMNIHKKDVRVTNNYSKGDFYGPVFSAIHETGHALYEQGISDAFALTIVGEGTSMGMHEAMSRFYENMIGRNRAFWSKPLEKAKNNFHEQFADVTEDCFFERMNKVECGPIRIDADELTYPFHVIIRYELEKKIISGIINVKDLKNEWNRLYKEYLGVEPDHDACGVLQDVHWATGEFGYFPSYLLGSAVAAQIYAHLQKVMPVDEYLKEGRLDEIKKYLSGFIFRYGKSKKTGELLYKMTGEEFNINYYTDYLCGKFGKEQ